MFRDPQVNFYVEDIDASVGFYRGLLGFAETFRAPPQGRPSHVELRSDGFTFGLATVESLRDVHGVTSARARRGPRSSCGPTMWMRRSPISRRTAFVR